MLCAQPFKEKCPADVHTMSWKCHQGRPATCSACDRLAKALERQAKLDIKAQEQRDKAQREYDMKMIELQAKLQYQQDALNDMQAQKDRQNELKQKEKEIEDVKQQVRDAETAAKKAVAKANALSQNPSQDAANGPPPSTSNAAAPPRPMFPSAAREKWEDQKRVDGVQNDAIDKIMDMTGLEQVKEKILRIKGSLDTMRRQDVPIDKERINLVLLGNPGTGATHCDIRRKTAVTPRSRKNHGCEALCNIPRVHQGAPGEHVSGDYGFQTLLRRSARRSKADR